MASSTGGKGGRKIGRGMKSPSHSRYVATSRRKINKIKRLRKHLKKCENDQFACKVLKKLE